MSQCVLMLPLIALSLIITGPASLKALAAQIERMRAAEKRAADNSGSGSGLLDASSSLPPAKTAMMGSPSAIHVVPHSSAASSTGLSGSAPVAIGAGSRLHAAANDSGNPYGGGNAVGAPGGAYGTVGTVATSGTCCMRQK
jgi:hypothetical protein